MEMIYPMFALALLISGVGVALGITRLMSVKKRQVSPSYFRLLNGDTPPEVTLKLARNFTNLFEVPVLFFTLGALVVATGASTPLLTSLAWSFVALRLVHTAIHVTYNHPLHRFFAFLMSFLVVLTMWMIFILQLSTAAR